MRKIVLGALVVISTWFYGTGASMADSPDMKMLKAQNRLLKNSIQAKDAQIKQLNAELVDVDKKVQALRVEIAKLRELCLKNGIHITPETRVATPERAARSTEPAKTAGPTANDVVLEAYRNRSGPLGPVILL